MRRQCLSDGILTGSVTSLFNSYSFLTVDEIPAGTSPMDEGQTATVSFAQVSKSYWTLQFGRVGF